MNSTSEILQQNMVIGLRVWVTRAAVKNEKKLTKKTSKKSLNFVISYITGCPVKKFFSLLLKAEINV